MQALVRALEAREPEAAAWQPTAATPHWGNPSFALAFAAAGALAAAAVLSLAGRRS